MKNRCTFTATLMACVAAVSAFPAQAEIRKQDDNGFWISHIAEVSASPDELWKRLIAPKDWWNKEHSWSGSVDGFYIDAQAGGCFCELMKEAGQGQNAKLQGSVEHMRVIFAQPGKVLRMQGALGPLQSEAVMGTLTVTIAPIKGKEGRSAISFNYLVGGFMRFETAQIAKAVDDVLGEQFGGLVKPFAKSESGIPESDEFKLDFEGLEEESADNKPAAKDKKPADKETKKEAQPVTAPDKAKDR